MFFGHIFIILFKAARQQPSNQRVENELHVGELRVEDELRVGEVQVQVELSRGHYESGKTTTSKF